MRQMRHFIFACNISSLDGKYEPLVQRMEKVWHFATLEADETRRSKLAQRDYRLTIGSRDSQTSFDHTRFWQGSALRSGPVWT